MPFLKYCDFIHIEPYDGGSIEFTPSILLVENALVDKGHIYYQMPVFAVIKPRL